jgi:small conductance mechanosensitive channel
MDFFGAVLFLVYISLLWTFSQAIYVLVRRWREKKADKRKAKSTAKLYQYVFLAIGIYVGISYILDITIDDIMLTLGVVSIVVAFISKRILENVIAGGQLNVEKRIEVEDWVELSKHNWKGPAKVVDISLTKTTLRDTDGTEFCLPNTDINDSQFINYSKTGYAELDIELPLPLDTDLNELERILMPVITSNPDVFPNVKYEVALHHSGLAPKSIKKLLQKNIDLHKLEPKITIVSVKDKYLVFNVRAYVAEVNKVIDVKSQLTWSMWNELRAAGKTL